MMETKCYERRGHTPHGSVLRAQCSPQNAKGLKMRPRASSGARITRTNRPAHPNRRTVKRHALRFTQEQEEGLSSSKSRPPAFPVASSSPRLPILFLDFIPRFSSLVLQTDDSLFSQTKNSGHCCLSCPGLDHGQDALAEVCRSSFPKDDFPPPIYCPSPDTMGERITFSFHAL